MSTQRLHTDNQNTFICNQEISSQKLETTQMSISWWMDKSIWLNSTQIWKKLKLKKKTLLYVTLIKLKIIIQSERSLIKKSIYITLDSMEGGSRQGDAWRWGERAASWRQELLHLGQTRISTYHTVYFKDTQFIVCQIYLCKATENINGLHMLEILAELIFIFEH